MLLAVLAFCGCVRLRPVRCTCLRAWYSVCVQPCSSREPSSQSNLQSGAFEATTIKKQWQLKSCCAAISFCALRSAASRSSCRHRIRLGKLDTSPSRASRCHLRLRASSLAAFKAVASSLAKGHKQALHLHRTRSPVLGHGSTESKASAFSPPRFSRLFTAELALSRLYNDVEGTTARTQSVSLSPPAAVAAVVDGSGPRAPSLGASCASNSRGKLRKKTVPR